jgi:omega-hydroxy-beta-dihydromenaquinone-9 sulfotransferase
MVEIRQPIFFVGMGRSGTTVMFQAFAAHPDLAWFSQYLNRQPRFPIVAVLSRIADWSPSMRQATSRSDQHHAWLERLRVGPAEANTVWQRCCGKDFIYGYQLGVQATAAEHRCLRRMVSSVLRYQGKPRFAAKLTGPARLEYLMSIFPDARFVHVIRDGRAVVRSLMRVPFWRDTWRMDRPAWHGGLGDRELGQWEAYERSPLALAAIQWRAVVRSARQEAARFAPARYSEVRYEDFIADPHTALDELAGVCDLPSSQAPHQFLEERIELRDMNVQWRSVFTDDELQMLNTVMGDTLEEFEYGSASAQPRSGEGLVTMPFRRQNTIGAA